MKNKISITFLAISISSVIVGQNYSDLNLAYNDTHSGRSLVLTISKTFHEKNEIGIGVRYNINKLAHDDDQMNTYWNRQYATSFLQHMGMEAFYHRYIIPQWQYAKPYIFYDLQLSHSDTRNRMYLPVIQHEEYGILYRKVIEYFGPFTWIEQTIGIGLKTKLTERLYLNQKGGGGIIFIIGKDDQLPSTLNNFQWEFAGLYQIGLTYRF